jgi:hypothetical protein
MNWLPTLFLGTVAMLGLCWVVGIAEDGLRKAAWVVRVAEMFQRERGR